MLVNRAGRLSKKHVAKSAAFLNTEWPGAHINNERQVSLAKPRTHTL